jgi:hypothetical protein
VTPEPSRRRIRGLLGIASIAAMLVAGAVLAFLLSGGGGGSTSTEAGPGAGVLPTAPASVPPATSRPGRPRAASPGTWPVGLTGFTVVLATLAKRDHPRAEAERLARSVQLPGLRAHVLDSSLHPRLRSSVWIVYVGRYSTRSPAERIARRLHAGGARRGVVERLTG